MTFVEEMDCLSPTHGSRSQKEDCTHGRHLETGSTSVGLHPYEASIQNSVKDVQTLPGADIDSDHNLTDCQSLHQVEENNKIPKEQT